MKVVLLERVDNLGAIGDVVTVKDGFARNFLLPRDKARRATAANLKAFELDRAAIEQRNEKNKAEAGAQNVRFLKGHIEEIPLPDNSVDVIISNCLGLGVNIVATRNVDATL